LIRIRPVLLALLWLLLGGSVVVLLGAAFVDSRQEPFVQVIVDVDESDGNLFVSRQDVLLLLKDHQLNAEKKKQVGSIGYESLERAIESNPFVRSAEIFVDAQHNIRVSVQQRLPVLRIINSQRVSYYLDDRRRRMPCSPKFTARVPVATGNIFTNAEHADSADLMLEKKLFVLTDFIRHDSLLNALFAQIVVNEKQEFELIPLLGDHSVLIGDADNLENKFSKLRIFYREGLNRTGWQQYSLINLKYAGEVYATKRDSAGPHSESADENSKTKLLKSENE
jgi:cell division protein FtsQ